MSLKFNILTSGVKAANSKVDSITRAIERKAQGARETFAVNTVTDARLNLNYNGTNDTGVLAQSIQANAKVGEAFVTDHAPYAPYVEFGTRGQFRVPNDPEIKRVAAQFKGKSARRGGSFYSNIQDWIRRKIGVQQSLSYAFVSTVIKNLVTKGSKAQPFFFPAVKKNEKKYIKKLKAIYNA